MVRPNPRYGEAGFVPVDIFVMIDGYSRNLILEQKLEDESIQADDSIKNMGQFNPRSGYAVPSWWEGVRDPSEYGWGFTTHQKALDYLKLSQRYYQAKINLFNYRCSNYPRDPVFCQHSTQYSGTLGKINSLITIIEKRITGFQFPDISLPEIIIEEEEILEEIQEEEEPEIFGEIEVVLTDQVKQIISDIENGVVLVPDWFVNNIDWVKTGQITQQEFVTAYNYSRDQGWIHAPTEEQKGF